MIWIGVAALAFVAWLSIALCFLALCRAAAQADKRMQRPTPTFGESAAVATSEPGGTVIDLRAFLSSRTARSARYFNSRESRRSLSTRPSVWQVGQ